QALPATNSDSPRAAHAPFPGSRLRPPRGDWEPVRRSRREYPASLRVDQHVDVFGESVGDLADDVAAQHVYEGVALRGAQDEAGSADGGGNVDNGIGRGLAD